MPDQAESPQKSEKKYSTLVVPGGPSQGQEVVSYLQILTGASAGMVYELICSATTLGRDPSCQIVLVDPEVSRQHAFIVEHPKGHYKLNDLDSTNGTFVGAERISRHSLNNGDRIGLGGELQMKFLTCTRDEFELARKLYESARLDRLTRALRRDSFVEMALQHFEVCRRQQRGISLVLLDLDHFQKINDDYGQLEGDAVLRTLADLLRKSIGPEDVLGRLNSEEFALLLLEEDDRDMASAAEQIRRGVECMRVVTTAGQEVRMTCSLGLATWDLVESLDSVMARADAALSEAKHLGRNRVVIA